MGEKSFWTTVSSNGDTVAIHYDDAKRTETWVRGESYTMVWYNVDGKIDSVVTEAGDTLRYTRDVNDQPSVIPHVGVGGAKLRWNERGLLDGFTPNGKEEHQFIYNTWGGDSLYIPPGINSNEGIVSYRHDAMGRLVGVTYSNQTEVEASYDGLSRWNKLRFGENIIDYQYNGNGRVYSLATRVNNDGSMQSLALTTAANDIAGETWSGEINGSVSRTRNLQGALNKVIVGNDVIQYRWTLGGQLLAAGDEELRYHLFDGRTYLSTLENIQQGISFSPTGLLKADSTVYRGVILYKEELQYESSGRISGKTEIVNGETVAWEYTYSNGRLATVTRNGVPVGSYGWDGNGNRSGAFVDKQDRLVSQGDANWTYDALGNLDVRIDGRGAWDFNYDELWNLVSATGQQSISYVVDARNRRVGRRVNGILTQGFLYDGQLNIVAELSGDGSVQSRFVYGTRSNVPDYMIKGNAKYKIITDHLGSVRLIVNASDGSVVSRIDYDVWGNVTNSNNLSFQPFGFGGGLRDDATGFTVVQNDFPPKRDLTDSV